MKIFVIFVHNNMVDDLYSFEEDEVSMAEDKFVSLLRAKFKKPSQRIDEEFDNILDDGFYQEGNKSLQIFWK